MRAMMDPRIAEIRDGGNCMPSKKAGRCNSPVLPLKVLKKTDSLGYKRFGQAGFFRQQLKKEKTKQKHIRDLVSQLFDGDPVKLIEIFLGNNFMDKETPNAPSCVRNLRLAI
jgi:hypothetical protein